MVEIDTPGHTAIIAEAHPDYVACPGATPWATYANGACPRARPRCSVAEALTPPAQSPRRASCASRTRP